MFRAPATITDSLHIIYIHIYMYFFSLHSPPVALNNAFGCHWTGATLRDFWIMKSSKCQSAITRRHSRAAEVQRCRVLLWMTRLGICQFLLVFKPTSITLPGSASVKPGRGKTKILKTLVRSHLTLFVGDERRGKGGRQPFIVPSRAFRVNYSGSRNNCLFRLWVHLPR